MAHIVQVLLQEIFWNWGAAAARCREKGYSAIELALAVRKATEEMLLNEENTEDNLHIATHMDGLRYRAILGKFPLA